MLASAIGEEVGWIVLQPFLGMRAAVADQHCGAIASAVERTSVRMRMLLCRKPFQISCARSVHLQVCSLQVMSVWNRETSFAPAGEAPTLLAPASAAAALLMPTVAFEGDSVPVLGVDSRRLAPGVGAAVSPEAAMFTWAG